jgi:Family of unknown function (DUF6065)
MPDDTRRIHAYEVHEPRDMPIRRAPLQRDWMDATDQRFAYRCLPLVIANQAGWLIHNPAGFTASWNGGPRLEDLRLDFGEGLSADPFSFRVWVGTPPSQPADARIMSHFGNGVVTFTLPYLFRTPPGVSLWVKGPSNWVKDGVCALEGVVESDWSPATFTMNWKLTRPGLAVRFERGEPICMIVPVTRGLAESLEPRQAPLRSDPDLEAAYNAWQAERHEFLQALGQGSPDAVERGWQKDYFQGVGPQGTRVEGHQTHLRLKDFVRESP